MRVKNLAPVLWMATSILIAQSTNPTSPEPIAPSIERSTPIPKHRVYAHFLAMVKDLDQRAKAAGATDPYQFAQAFSRAGFASADLDLLRQEASALSDDLAILDQRAKLLIDAYRANARETASTPNALPTLPIEINQLDAERTAVMINHMVRLQTNLGKDKIARLDAYFSREFIPRISLKTLSHPPANVSASQAVPSGTSVAQP